MITLLRDGMAQRSARKKGIRLWRWLGLGVLLCLFVPMRYTCLKVGLLAGGVGLWCLTVHLYWGRLWVRAVCILIAGAACVVLAFLALPGRPYDARALRRKYVRSLLSYRGTLYVWGGGNRLGVDCSGLVQSGLTNAYLERALATRNPGLARAGLSLWWHSRSARALGEGYRGETRLVREVPSLNGADYSLMEPGDLAVLSDGVHVLAYVCSDTWIEADPGPMRVVLARAPRERDYYFNAPVRLMRWRALD